MYERKHDWHEIIKSVDPTLDQHVTAFTGHVLATDSEIPRKYKELILMAQPLFGTDRGRASGVARRCIMARAIRKLSKLLLWLRIPQASPHSSMGLKH